MDPRPSVPEMKDTVRSAFHQLLDGGDPAAQAEPIDDEELALLLEGRLDDLATDRRERLLRLVASQPWARSLLRDLAAEENDAPPLYPPTHAPARKRPQRRLLGALWVGWVLAACLTLSVAGWGWLGASSHKSGAGVDSLQIGTAEVHDPTAVRSLYWDDLDRQRLVSIEERQRWRDMVLFGAAFLCVIMSIALVVVVTRKDTA